MVDRSSLGEMKSVCRAMRIEGVERIQLSIMMMAIVTDLVEHPYVLKEGVFTSLYLFLCIVFASIVLAILLTVP